MQAIAARPFTAAVQKVATRVSTRLRAQRHWPIDRSMGRRHACSCCSSALLHHPPCRPLTLGRSSMPRYPLSTGPEADHPRRGGVLRPWCVGRATHACCWSPSASPAACIIALASLLAGTPVRRRDGAAEAADKGEIAPLSRPRPRKGCTNALAWSAASPKLPTPSIQCAPQHCSAAAAAGGSQGRPKATAHRPNRSPPCRHLPAVPCRSCTHIPPLSIANPR